MITSTWRQPEGRLAWLPSVVIKNVQNNKIRMVAIL